MSIRAFSENDTFEGPYNMQFPLLLNIFGVPRSGKSHMLFNIVKQTKNEFDEIVVFLGTRDSADGFLSLVEKKKTKPIIKILFSFNSEDFMTYIKKIETEQNAALKAKKATKRYLFVFDDILGLGNKLMTHNRASPSPLAMLGANYRHYNISLIICSQSYFDIIKPIRCLCCKYTIICSVGLRDIQKVGEEFETLYFTKNNIVDMFKDLRSNGIGNCLLIDNYADDKHKFKWIHPDNSLTLLTPPQ